MYTRRRPKRWRIPVMVILTIVFVMIGAVVLRPDEEHSDFTESVPETASEDVRVYFPANPGMVYNFAGEGMEYAPFTRRVRFIEDQFVHVDDANAGTIMGIVYRRL